MDGFDVDLRGGSPQDMIRRVDRDEADWGHTLGAVFMDPALGLVAKYGINRSELFVRPGLTLRMLAFNSARPLFRNNPNLRRAVNFALDRSALLATSGGPVASRPSDQYLPPGVPGFRDVDVYPLSGSSLSRARELARGNLRSGKAVFYVPDFPLPLQAAQLVRQQLAEIGLDVGSGRSRCTSRPPHTWNDSPPAASAGTSRSSSGRRISRTRTPTSICSSRRNSVTARP